MKWTPSRRGSRFPAMRMLLCTLVGVLAACGPYAGNAKARWTGTAVDVSLAGEARGGWCPVNRTVLVDAVQGDRAAGFKWRFDSLSPGTYPIGLPSDADSLGS